MTGMTRSALLAAAVSTAVGAGAWADTVSPGRDQNIQIPQAPAPAEPSGGDAAEFNDWQFLMASCIDAHELTIFDLIPMVEPVWDRGDKPVRKLSRRIEGEIHAIHLKFQAERSAPNKDQRAQHREDLANECADSLRRIKSDVAAQVSRSGGKRINSFVPPSRRPYLERMDMHGQNH